MNKLKDRWLRRWSDENGELCAVIRERGAYWLRFTVPAWESGAGSKSYRKVKAEEARSYDYDPTGDYTCTDNDQAQMEHDPFFS